MKNTPPPVALPRYSLYRDPPDIRLAEANYRRGLWFFIIVLSVFAAALIVCAMGGCQAVDQAAGVAKASAAADQADALAAKAKAIGNADAARDFTSVATGLREAATKLATANAPTTTEAAAGGAITAAAAAAGGPFAPIIAGAIGLVGLVVQQVRVQKRDEAARSLVNLVDVLRARYPDVADKMKADRQVLDDQLTPLARSIVADERLDHGSAPAAKATLTPAA